MATKQLQLFAVIAILALSACNSETSNGQTATTGTTENTSGSTNNQANPNNTFWEELVMHEIKDNRGVVSATVPLPSSWKINANGSISGPNNLKVTNYPLHSFMMNYDPNLQYAYSQTPMRAMPEIGQLIQEDVVPSAQSLGFKYIKHYELPEVSKIDKWYSDQLYKAMPSESYIFVYGIDLEDRNGNPAFLLLHTTRSESQSMQSWGYFASLLEADNGKLEKAKKQYLFGVTNTRYNLEPIMAYNRSEAEKAGQSWAAFNKRMAANQAAFEAHQAAHINRTNAINDAIMSGWNERSKAMDKNQDQFLDYVYERQNVQNAETGEKHKVEYGYNRYWMNSDGEYIATQQQNYDPNADENMNQQNWQELNKIK